jgi:hypothetical protein
MTKCLSKMKVRKFKSGDTIISEGSVGTTMYVLLCIRLV